MVHIKQYLINYVFELIFTGFVGGNPDAKRLYDDLLSNYNKLVRPVVNVTDAVMVRLKLKLSQLIDVVSINLIIIYKKIHTHTVKLSRWHILIHLFATELSSVYICYPEIPSSLLDC